MDASSLLKSKLNVGTRDLANPFYAEQLILLCNVNFAPND
jgi:hypothetical protein